MKTDSVLKVMNVLFWIALSGLSVKTGAILFSYVVSMINDGAGASNLYLGLDLSELYAFGTMPYSYIVLLFVIVTGLKAYIAYLVVRIFMRFSFSSPFEHSITESIGRISQVAVVAASITIVARAYSEYIISQAVSVPLEWGSGEILLFAGVIYIITKVFERGTEIQQDNELTV